MPGLTYACSSFEAPSFTVFGIHVFLLFVCFPAFFSLTCVLLVNHILCIKVPVFPCSFLVHLLFSLMSYLFPELFVFLVCSLFSLTPVVSCFVTYCLFWTFNCLAFCSY